MTPIDLIIWVAAAAGALLIAAVAISIAIVMINTARRQK